ncbi:MAG: hypothetical protein PHE61_03360 [Candidatus Omnitrophica bacterium]|nr:hypothetical protein [Candidatus Omnitrophota bacterium]
MIKLISIVLAIFVAVAFMPVPAFSDEPVQPIAKEKSKKTATVTPTASAPAEQATLTQAEYEANMKKTLDRGYRNMLFSPGEVVIGIQDNTKPGTIPVVNVFWGFGMGLLKGMRRLGSGSWDVVAAFIPHQQQGMPVNPETIA